MEKEDNQIHNQPVVAELEVGTYHWCKCGDTKNGAMCDGSHVAHNEVHGTNIFPVEFTIEDKSKVALCTCKHTNTEPNCDGSHSKQS